MKENIELMMTIKAVPGGRKRREKEPLLEEQFIHSRCSIKKTNSSEQGIIFTLFRNTTQEN